MRIVHLHRAHALEAEQLASLLLAVAGKCEPYWHYYRCRFHGSNRFKYRCRRSGVGADARAERIIARKAEHATEVIVLLAKGRGARAVVCGTEKRRENLRSRMTKPKRIQRSRAKGWKMPANAIYVGRPTVWGNPYVVGSVLMNGETLTAEKAVELYEQHLADNFSERGAQHRGRPRRAAGRPTS